MGPAMEKLSLPKFGSSHLAYGGLASLIVLFLLGVACTSSTQTAPTIAGSPTPTPTATSTTTPTPTPSPTATPTPVSSATAFSISVAYDEGSSQYPIQIPTSVLHRSATNSLLGVPAVDADWSNPCVVPTPANQANAGLRDYYCTLEIAELDLYFNNMTITWSAPAGMCTYVEVAPFWFYQFPPFMDTGTHYSYTLNTTSTPPTCAFDGVDGGNGGGQAYFGPGCAFTNIADYSAEHPAGPNCAEGPYTLTITNVSSSGSTASVTQTYWGGAVGNCAAGPMADTKAWPIQRESFYNLPMSLIDYSVSGLDPSPLKITAPINDPAGPLGTDLWSANFLNTYPPLAAAIPGTPNALRFQSVAGVPGSQPNPYYKFICYDDAKDAIGMIWLSVRRWTTASELAKGPAGNPNLTGSELPFPGNLHDYDNWDDLNGNAGTYPSGYPWWGL